MRTKNSLHKSTLCQFNTQSHYFVSCLISKWKQLPDNNMPNMNRLFHIKCKYIIYFRIGDNIPWGIVLGNGAIKGGSVFVYAVDRSGTCQPWWVDIHIVESMHSLCLCYHKNWFACTVHYGSGHCGHCFAYAVYYNYDHLDLWDSVLPPIPCYIWAQLISLYLIHPTEQ